MLVLLAGNAALAQDWPSKPITVVMGFPAGSGVDVVAARCRSLWRRHSTRASFQLPPGAGGNISFRDLARARPDGYTLLLGTAATHGINPALYRNLAFDVEADFTPIAPLVDVSNVLTINPDVIDVSTGQRIHRQG